MRKWYLLIVWTLVAALGASVRADAEVRVVPLKHVHCGVMVGTLNLALISPEVIAELGEARVVNIGARTENNENAVVVEGDPEAIEVVETLIQALDRRPRLIQIELKLVETMEPEVFFGRTELEDVAVTLPSGRTVAVPPTQPRAVGGLGAATASLFELAGNPVAVNPKLDMGALDRGVADNVGRILHAPRVTMEEGAEATLDFSPEYGVPEATGEGEPAQLAERGSPAFRCQPVLLPDGRICVRVQVVWETAAAFHVVLEQDQPLAIAFLTGELAAEDEEERTTPVLIIQARVIDDIPNP